VPKNCAPERIENLNEGGLFPHGPISSAGRYKLASVRNTLYNFVELLIALRQSYGDLVCYLLEPYPGYSPNSVENIVQVNSREYYRFCITRNTDRLKLADEIDSHRESWSFLLLCSDLASRSSAGSAIEMDANFIATQAYDGESFCCWISNRWQTAQGVLNYEGCLRQPSNID
jgi:hypothetical protein